MERLSAESHEHECVLEDQDRLPQSLRDRNTALAFPILYKQLTYVWNILKSHASIDIIYCLLSSRTFKGYTFNDILVLQRVITDIFIVQKNRGNRRPFKMYIVGLV